MIYKNVILVFKLHVLCRLVIFTASDNCCPYSFRQLPILRIPIGTAPSLTKQCFNNIEVDISILSYIG